MTLEISGGNFIVSEAGRTALDTSVPMMSLVPGSAIALTNYSISFPDLLKGTIYHQTRRTDDLFNIDYFACSTWTAPIEQEWGPGEPSPRTLADITLGTVPAGTDYLEVWVNLTRTVTPAKLFDLTLRSTIVAGVDIKLEGGSCLIESMFGVRRLFEIVLVGTTVKLRRYQSVTANGAVLRQNPGASSGNQTFFYPGTDAPVDGTKYACYGQRIQTRGEDSNDTHRPAGKEAGSSNNTPCSMSHAGISYASTWTGAITITPGRIGA